MTRRSYRRGRTGTTLLLTLMIAIILAALAGTSFRLLQEKYRLVHQAASWQEALLSAEAGVDLAVNQMRLSLAEPDAAWQGWQTASGNSSESGPSDSAVYFSSTVLLRNGEGGQRSYSDIEVDAPEFLRDESGEQWFRVRSLGVSEVPDGSVVAGSKPDLVLRKLDLVTNHRTGERVLHPQATRLIEAIVKPVGTFRLALMGIESINLNNHNIVVDSYDSRNQNKSTDGLYDVTKRQSNGHIATNGQLIEAGNAHIYGTASTNGGTVNGAGNVTGGTREDFYQEILPVESPNVVPDAGSPTRVNTAAILDARAGDPAQYVLTSIDLSGQNILRIRGAADGGETFAQIVVTGNVRLTGQAKIQLDPGVYLRMFVQGDSDLSGQGVSNPQPNRPAHFQFYGVDRPPLSDGRPAPLGQITIAGNGGFTGSVYAPNYHLTMVGGGYSDSIYGGFLAHTISMTGVQSVHFDEALADGGLISDYKVVSWFEDAR